MRVLVTGGAGFIGSHVVEALRNDGHHVQVVDILLPAAHPHYPHGRPPGLAGVDLLVGDLRDRTVVDRALAGVDLVVHQAAMVGHGTDAQDMPAYAGLNDLGTAMLLAGMDRAGIGRLVLASSMVVYGEGRYRCAEHGTVRPGPRHIADLQAGRFEPGCPDCGRPLTGETVPESAPLDPRSTYAASKVAQEHLCAAWARTTGGIAVGLRYHNVYGPRMPSNTPYAGVASIFRSALERGEAPRVFEDGGQRRDFVHVRDVAAANVAAVDETARGTAGALAVYNVGSGRPHTVGDMAEALATAFGGPRPVVTGEFRAADVRHVVACTDRARTGLGFHARIGFAEGMTEFATAPLRGPATAVTA